MLICSVPLTLLLQTELIDSFDSSSPVGKSSGLSSTSSAVSTVVALAEDESSDYQPEEQLIGFSNATFSWSREDEKDFVTALTIPTPDLITSSVTEDEGIDSQEEISPSQPRSVVPRAPQLRKFFLAISNTVLFHHNCINLIVGPTGSGKTAMLLALLGSCLCIYLAS